MLFFINQNSKHFTGAAGQSNNPYEFVVGDHTYINNIKVELRRVNVDGIQFCVFGYGHGCKYYMPGDEVSFGLNNLFIYVGDKFYYLEQSDSRTGYQFTLGKTQTIGGVNVELRRVNIDGIQFCVFGYGHGCKYYSEGDTVSFGDYHSNLMIQNYPSGTNLLDLPTIYSLIPLDGDVDDPPAPPPSDTEFYGNSIIISNQMTNEFSEIVTEELGGWLNKMTNEQFVLSNVDEETTSSNDGIFLFLSDSSFVLANAPASIEQEINSLRLKHEDSYLISSSGSQLWIVGNSDEALKNGMYYFLEKLGMRFYFPQDHWTITPQLNTLDLTIHELREPEFENVRFLGQAGQGTIGRNLPNLPGVQLDFPHQKWGQWMSRQSLPYSLICLGGHIYDDFNVANQGELRINPLNLAELNGVRQELRIPCVDEKCDTKPAYAFHGTIECQGNVLRDPPTYPEYFELENLDNYDAVLSAVQVGGHIQDDSGNEFHGNIVGTSFGTSEINQNLLNEYSLEFNDVEDKMRTPIDFEMGVGDYSLSGWVYFNAVPTDKQHLFGIRELAGARDFGFYLYVEDGKIKVKNRGWRGQSNGAAATLIAESSFNPGWNYLVATRGHDSGSSFTKLFINGVFVGEASVRAGDEIVDIAQRTLSSGNVYYADHDFFIGSISKRNGDIIENFNGRVDDVRLFDRILTQNEINDLFGNDELSAVTNPLFHYTFNEEWYKEYCENPTDYSSDDGLIKLYTDWSLGEYQKYKQTYGKDLFISVDPSDGPGHDEGWKSLNILRYGDDHYDFSYLTPEQRDQDSSISDRVFHLGNNVAKKVAPYGGSICLNAYSEYANIPNIPLESNTYVSLVAYEFQRTGLHGDKLLEKWFEKSRLNQPGRFSIGIYDYLFRTDGAYDDPERYPSLDEAIRRFRFWESQGVRAVDLETTYATGVVGVHLYVLARLSWDINLDENQIIDEFYTLSFGPAKEPMKRLIDRWNSDKFILGKPELGVSFADLEEASAIAVQSGDINLQKRINDYKTFLYYLGLKYKEGAFLFKGDGSNQETIANELFEYLWSSYNSLTMHTYRLNQLYGTLGSFGSRAVRNLWYDTNSNIYQSIVQNTPADVQQKLDSGLDEVGNDLFEEITSLDLTRKFTSDLFPLTIPLSSTNTLKTAIGSGDLYYMFFNPSPQAISFTIEGFSVTRGTTQEFISLEDEAGNQLYYSELPIELQQARDYFITFPSLDRGKYYLKIGARSASAQIKDWPKNIPLMSVDSLYPRKQLTTRDRIYFYVPKDVRKFAIYTKIVGALPFYIYNNLDSYTDPVSGSNPHPEFGYNFKIVDVPVGLDDTIWAMTGNVKLSDKQPIKLIGIPSNFAFSEDHVMIPRELCDDSQNFNCIFS